jgi:DNA-binding helix-hairpin-helix protein with protein kinase domain
MDQPPGTPSVSDFSPHVAATFERAFSREGIRQRPQAQEWAAVLDALELTLVKCDENPLHYIPRDASDCAWCEMERQVGVALFVVHVPAAQLVQGHDPGAQRFPLDDLWRRITQIHAATGTQFTPKFQALQVAPSSEAKRAKRQLGSSPWGAYGVMLAAVAGFMAVPKAFFLWVIVFFGGVFMSQSRKSLDGTPFRSAFTACDQLYARELLNWQRRNGVDDFLRLFTELENAKSEYELLAREETRQTSRYCEDRRNHQLQAFLDTFPIARASIRGIGAARRAVLASYGVDTAADVTRAKILSLPGFGESVARPLLDWRQKLEARFVYQPNSTAADHAAIAKIRTQIQARAAPLRQKLSAGPQNLTALAARFQQIASREDDILNRARRNLEQTRADLVYLGLAVPASAPAAPGPSRATSTPAPSVAAPMPRASGPSPASGVQCPRCGSGMTKRLARRGRNAGGYFWGCNRYPACKGTRNI